MVEPFIHPRRSSRMNAPFRLSALRCNVKPTAAFTLQAHRTSATSGTWRFASAVVVVFTPRRGRDLRSGSFVGAEQRR